MPSFKIMAGWNISLTLLLSVYASCAGAQNIRIPFQKIEPNLLILEVRLDQQLVSDEMTAYQYGKETFLPLGGLARLLTLAIKTQPELGTAGGYVLDEERGFSLSLPKATVTIGDKSEPVDLALVKVEP